VCVCVGNIDGSAILCLCTTFAGKVRVNFLKEKKKIKTAYSGELMNMNCSRHKAADV
jgi:hypothetical protein